MNERIGFREIRHMKLIRRTFEVHLWESLSVDSIIKNLKKLPEGSKIVEHYSVDDGAVTVLVFEKEAEIE